MTILEAMSKLALTSANADENLHQNDLGCSDFSPLPFLVTTLYNIKIYNIYLLLLMWSNFSRSRTVHECTEKIIRVCIICYVILLCTRRDKTKHAEP